MLDGVRGVAILAVLAYHAGYLRGGFLGVDMFFVLSGFLITTILLEEVGLTGSINLGNFYIRRALRLLPALLSVLIGCTVTVAALAWADGVRDLWGVILAPMVRDSLAALFYVANWAMIQGMGMYILGHTWSLSIEEQFYLVWPLGLITLIRFVRARPAILGLVGVGIVTSISWRWVLLGGGASVARIFLGFDTRFDALLMGCLVALAAVWNWLPRSPLAVGAMRVVTAIAVAFLGYLLVSANWQSWYMLTSGASLAAAAVAVVIVHVLISPSGVVARALGWRPLVSVGRISYGLYLWHFPILYGFSALSPDGLTPNPRGAVPALLLTFLVAGLSFSFMERPILRLKERFSPTRATAPSLFVIAKGDAKRYEYVTQRFGSETGVEIIYDRRSRETPAHLDRRRDDRRQNDIAPALDAVGWARVRRPA